MAKFQLYSQSPAVQDYLKAILILQEAGLEASTSKVCAYLNHVPASATGMFKRLAELDLVTYTPYSGVHLTPAGDQLARKVLRAHRLLELYLVQRVGFEADQVHREAEAMEHAISDEFIDRIDTLLGAPRVGVHGESIPQLAIQHNT